jgi:hypothetical protein
MPLLLIGVRESRWFKGPAQEWLDRGDVPADPIGDLRTTDNRLSVWEIAPDRSNIERVVRALVLGKDKVADSGYVLFDSALLGEIGIAAPERVLGTTADTGANAWHSDLIQLSGNQLVGLTRAILTRGETGHILKKRLVQLIEEGIAASELPERLRQRILK